MKRLYILLGVLVALMLVFPVSGAIQDASTGYAFAQIADINPGAAGSAVNYLTEFNNKLYFSADDGIHGRELWVYDGVNPPSMVEDIKSGSGSSFPSDLVVYDGKLYFSAYGSSTTGSELWVYDGINPTSMVEDINPGSGDSNPQEFAIFNDKLYFQATFGSNDAELWVYDGSNPPHPVADINPIGGSYVAFLTVLNEKLYFTAGETTHGLELWVYDGTNPPSMVEDINPGTGHSAPVYLTVFRGKLYFGAYTTTKGYELWVHDDYYHTSMVADINLGSGNGLPKYLTVYNGNLYFQANDGINGPELWVYDGTVHPPHMVADINEGSGGSSPIFLTAYHDNLYFSADDGKNGKELWASNGESPPSLVADINYGSEDSTPLDLFVFTDKLFFSANDGIKGSELWVFESVIFKDMFYSQAAYDGWVLETGENTNKGGLINTSNLICNVGDDAQNKQFRTILHFNTSRIPDDAVVTKVTLQYKQHSIIGSDPYATHGKVWADIKDGYFSINAPLVQSDFAAGPSMGFAGNFSFYPSALAYPIYRAELKDADYQYINLDGITQFRLRFAMMMTTTIQLITSRSSAGICRYPSTGRCCGCGITCRDEIRGQMVRDH